MKSLARIFQFDGYKTLDVHTSTKDRTIKVDLERCSDKPGKCHRCGGFLGRKRGQHRVRVKQLSIMGFETEIRFWRYKGHCSRCKKARSEAVSFLSKESPHLTQELSDWLGTMCEFASVSRVAEFCKQNASTLRNLDFKRLKRMLKHYKIPEVTHIAVDEVYARKKSKFKGESRNERFFTVITDLNTRKVIWVSQGRSKEALDQFYALLGAKACKKILVVAMDQFDGYAAATKDSCPNATVVWDKFHIMQNLQEAVNETRKELHGELSSKDPLFHLTRGKHKYIFLKRGSKRSGEETEHIEAVLKENGRFLFLELIKERMLTFFEESSADNAKDVLDQLTAWAWQAKFDPLKRYFDNLHKGWDTLKNYFSFRVTTALAEGTNNVIKALKRQAFGYRDMDYFRYKIMQKCGYLNSRYISGL